MHARLGGKRFLAQSSVEPSVPKVGGKTGQRHGKL
jgi:hypothetical protein